MYAHHPNSCVWVIYIYVYEHKYIQKDYIYVHMLVCVKKNLQTCFAFLICCQTVAWHVKTAMATVAATVVVAAVVDKYGRWKEWYSHQDKISMGISVTKGLRPVSDGSISCSFRWPAKANQTLPNSRTAHKKPIARAPSIWLKLILASFTATDMLKLDKLTASKLPETIQKVISRRLALRSRRHGMIWRSSKTLMNMTILKTNVMTETTR